MLDLSKFSTQFDFHFKSHSWGNEIFMADKNGHSFGRIYWYLDDIETVYFEGLRVGKNFRKKGLGTKVLETLENIGSTIGAKTSCLWVDKTKWMHDWYQRKGYTDWIIHEQEENCIWMRKKLI